MLQDACRLCLLGMYATGYWMVSPSRWLYWWRLVLADYRAHQEAADREMMDWLVRQLEPVVMNMVSAQDWRADHANRLHRL